MASKPLPFESLEMVERCVGPYRRRLPHTILAETLPELDKDAISADAEQLKAIAEAWQHASLLRPTVRVVCAIANHDAEALESLWSLHGPHPEPSMHGKVVSLILAVLASDLDRDKGVVIHVPTAKQLEYAILSWLARRLDRPLLTLTPDQAGEYLDAVELEPRTWGERASRLAAEYEESKYG